MNGGHKNALVGKTRKLYEMGGSVGRGSSGLVRVSTPTPAAALTFEWYAPDATVDGDGESAEEDEEDSEPKRSASAAKRSATTAKSSKKSPAAKADKAPTPQVNMNDAFFSTLARNRSTATIFLRPADAQGAAGAALVRSILAASCEIGLLGSDDDYDIGITDQLVELQAAVAAAEGPKSSQKVVSPSALGGSLTKAARSKSPAARVPAAAPASNARSLGAAPVSSTTGIKWFRPANGAADVIPIALAHLAGLRTSLATLSGVSTDSALAAAAAASPGDLNGAIYALPMPLPHVLCGTGGELDKLLRSFLASSGAQRLSTLSSLDDGVGQEEEAIK